MGLVLFFAVCVVAATALYYLAHNTNNNGNDTGVYDIVSMEAVPLHKKAFAEPKNETEFREIFESLASKLYGYKISISQVKCPDLLVYDKNSKKTIRAELEYRASDFFKHKHKWDTVDLIICWTNDIEKSDIPIIECKDRITEYYKNMAGAD